MNPAEQVLQYHIRIGHDVPLGKYCLLPGDPGRCAAIAAHFDDPVHQTTNREYCTWTGTLLGQPVSVCSTGIGGPSAVIALEGQIKRLMESFHILSGKKTDYTEMLDNSLSTLSRSIIDETVASLSVQPSRLTAEEKMAVISALEGQGVFDAKGAVAQVAGKLGISEPTVYRYLKKVRGEKQTNRPR